MSRLTPRLRILTALVVSAALSAGVTYVMTAGATTTDTTYFACLKAGKLTQVATSAPSCRGSATQISWNSVGPQGPPGATNPTTYTWKGTVPRQSGSLGNLLASTNLPVGSTVSLVSGSMSGDFTSCTNPLVYFGADTGGNVALWVPTGNVTGAAPGSTATVTLPSSQPMQMGVSCTSGNAPTVSFNVVFNVAPPPTTYN